MDEMYKDFQTCVTGCNTVDKCAVACSDPQVVNPNCMANCQVVTTCLNKAVLHEDSEGHASARTQVEECFETEVPTAPPEVQIGTPQPWSLIPQAPAAAATGLLETQAGSAPAPALVIASSPEAPPS